jgi:hypothetical protein
MGNKLAHCLEQDHDPSDCLNPQTLCPQAKKANYTNTSPRPTRGDSILPKSQGIDSVSADDPKHDQINNSAVHSG